MPVRTPDADECHRGRQCIPNKYRKQVRDRDPQNQNRFLGLQSNRKLYGYIGYCRGLSDVSVSFRFDCSPYFAFEFENTSHADDAIHLPGCPSLIRDEQPSLADKSGAGLPRTGERIRLYDAGILSYQRDAERTPPACRQSHWTNAPPGRDARRFLAGVDVETAGILRRLQKAAPGTPCRNARRADTG